jgi:hypothetical protein
MEISMKKLIAFLAFVVLATSFAFASGPVDPGSRGTLQSDYSVTNLAHVYIWCNHMIFTCEGPTDLNIVAGTTSDPAITDWKIENWGDTGKFQYDTTGFMEITPPSHGAASDITVNPVTAGSFTNGWGTTNLTAVSSHWDQYTLTTYACNSVGHMLYKFTVTAANIAVHGKYDIAFTLSFTEL